MGYGLWIQKHCKQAWETQKCMGSSYKGVWVTPGMGYEKFDCMYIRPALTAVLITRTLTSPSLTSILISQSSTQASHSSSLSTSLYFVSFTQSTLFLVLSVHHQT